MQHPITGRESHALKHETCFRGLCFGELHAAAQLETLWRFEACECWTASVNSTSGDLYFSWIKSPFLRLLDISDKHVSLVSWKRKIFSASPETSAGSSQSLACISASRTTSIMPSLRIPQEMQALSPDPTIFADTLSSELVASHGRSDGPILRSRRFDLDDNGCSA